MMNNQIINVMKKYVFLLLVCLYPLSSFSQTSGWKRYYERVEKEISEKKSQIETNKKIIIEISADTIKSNDDKRKELSVLEAEKNNLTREIETSERLLQTYETLIKNEEEAKREAEEKKERERLEEEKKRQDEEKREKLRKEHEETIKREVREKIENVHKNVKSQQPLNEEQS